MEIDFDEIEKNGGPSECVCDGAGLCPIYQQFIHKGVQHQCKTLQSARNQWWHTFRPDHSEEGRARFAEAQKISRAKVKYDKAIDELNKEGINPDSIDGNKKKGLGTTIANILSKIGVTKEVMKTVSGIEDCQCNKREDWLNKIFSKADVKEE